MCVIVLGIKPEVCWANFLYYIPSLKHVLSISIIITTLPRYLWLYLSYYLCQTTTLPTALLILSKVGKASHLS